MRPILLDNGGPFANNIKEIMKKVLPAMLSLSLFLYPVVSSAGISRNREISSVQELERVRHTGYIQKGAFEYRKNAKDLAARLKKRGYEVLIIKGVTSNKRKVYRVLARRTRVVSARGFHGIKRIAGTKTPAVTEKGSPEKDSAAQLGIGSGRTGVPALVRGVSAQGSPDAPSGTGSGLPAGALLVSQAGGNVVPGTSLQGEPPVGTLRTYSEIFGTKGRYLHPSLSVTEMYTDNAFSTKDNKKTNLSTILTPGIWLSLPRTTDTRLLVDDTWNRAPGGLVFTRYQPEVIRRYQADFLYKADIPLPSANSPYRNTVSHTGYGRLEYNGNKFSASLADIFVKSFDTRGLNVSTQPGEIDKYYNNFFEAAANVDTGNRLRVRLDYSSFLLHYNDERNSFMDRTDNSFSGYLFYRFKPKTAGFLEYRYIDISYLHDSTLDSNEHHFLAGVQWDITAKSQGMVKAGYGIKDFAGSSSNANTFIAEAQIRHHFTPRTFLTISGFRSTDETNIYTSSYTVTNQIEANYQQILTSRITGMMDLMYMHETYKGVEAGDTSSIEDNIYQATVGIQYEFQRWLRSSIGYVYTRRDSSFPDYDFTSNTAFFRVTGSL